MVARVANDLAFFYQLQNVSYSLLDGRSFKFGVVDTDDSGLTASQITALEGQGKHLWAYVSAGEAETFRDYWINGSWGTTPPDFLINQNPHWATGWRVKFWDQDWQDVVKARVAGIINKGYDGAYFDVVDVYTVQDVKTAFLIENPGGDIKKAMEDFIVEISQYAKSLNPNFKIVVQNAVALLNNSEIVNLTDPLQPNMRFLNAIDGLGKESTFTLGDTYPLGWTPWDKRYVENAINAGKFVIGLEYPTSNAAQQYALSNMLAAGYIPYFDTRQHNGNFLNINYSVLGLVDPYLIGLATGASTVGLALNGNGTDEVLTTYEGNDTVYGNGGNDQIVLGTGYDKGYGGDGNDTIYGLEGNDTLDGGSGSDRLYGWYGADSIIGGDGSDSIYGDWGNDNLDGGAGNDYIFGWDDHDSIIGGDGADVIWGDRGNDTIDCGQGDDIVYAGPDDDVIYGSSGNDQIYGDEGNDTIQGDAGNDYLYGWTGNDSIIGGGGNDIISGDAGADTIYAGTENDTVYAGDGNDIVYLGNGDDWAFGDGGDDIIFGDTGNDVIFGWAGSDQLFGEAGNDVLSAEDGADGLNGGDGNDSLYGGAGDDWLMSGNDGGTAPNAGTLFWGDYSFGGAGVDQFVYLRNSGVDFIADFVAGVDKVEISGFAGANFAATVAPNLTYTNGQAWLFLGVNQAIVFDAIAVNALTATDFIFS